jgi:hypothetical protein
MPRGHQDVGRGEQAPLGTSGQRTSEQQTTAEAARHRRHYRGGASAGAPLAMGTAQALAAKRAATFAAAAMALPPRSCRTTGTARRGDHQESGGTRPPPKDAPDSRSTVPERFKGKQSAILPQREVANRQAGPRPPAEPVADCAAK